MTDLIAVKNKRITIAQVNRAIGEKFPDVFLAKGEGYFYIASDNEEMGLRIAGLYTTSIPVYKLNEQTIEGWVRDVELLLNQED